MSLFDTALSILNGTKPLPNSTKYQLLDTNNPHTKLKPDATYFDLALSLLDQHEMAAKLDNLAEQAKKSPLHFLGKTDSKIIEQVANELGMHIDNDPPPTCTSFSTVTICPIDAFLFWCALRAHYARRSESFVRHVPARDRLVAVHCATVQHDVRAALNSLTELCITQATLIDFQSEVRAILSLKRSHDDPNEVRFVSLHMPPTFRWSGNYWLDLTNWKARYLHKDVWELLRMFVVCVDHVNPAWLVLDLLHIVFAYFPTNRTTEIEIGWPGTPEA
eukprot:TRINITY_DN65192_c0_g2_i1.p1 TRINITY_DN65192_c0_g2~~TRINITY_DN65192_c0_g2_i1.p1  ORF type:complete len:276 (-),score=5.69 TRINITY_DN65192_c0_g2_i1:96-923(-)